MNITGISYWLLRKRKREPMRCGGDEVSCGAVVCFSTPQHNTCRGEIYRAQDPPPSLHCKLKVSLASSARVLEPRRVTQRLNDTNTSGAINRAPTPEGLVRLRSIPSIPSIPSIRSKHLPPRKAQNHAILVKAAPIPRVSVGHPILREISFRRIPQAH